MQLTGAHPVQRGCNHGSTAEELGTHGGLNWSLSSGNLTPNPFNPRLLCTSAASVLLKMICPFPMLQEWQDYVLSYAKPCQKTVCFTCFTSYESAPLE